MIINYAHRGASGTYPENTMLSFEKAFELGASGIETDVQMTSDGVLVLIHDERVDRTTDRIGFVKDYTYNDIRKLDAGSWLSDEFQNQRIPSFEELLIFMKGNNLFLNLELKSNIIQYPYIEKKVIETIYKYDMADRTILSSFNHYSMVKCKEIDKNIKIGLLYMSGLYRPEHYAKFVGAEALHPYFYSLNEEIIRGIKSEGILINTFTVNDEKYMEMFIDSGIDGIITNYPEKLYKLLGV
ncbi:glycerophosphoryl diester phosphodiesterase [Clostridium tepidiprofundi DSM 19306]|uniref:Glycerophosphoryl diester phosphodiesterase n=1 Tax=Clostridium tepidiprofundi DSM 19306 TaxID=1121338 RepID=A0A151B6F6_9CLOT|nr:glycerophosphodiester phosphodiesterase [Clostridium tepidiprofundi]KYH35486.1 glycerophosphoryl diester phosphodiesterase [Clostridium tepidiprofundi DSM 19306]